MRSSKSLARKARSRKARTIGYVLFETSQIAIIATLKTANRKTGKMIQIWIILRDKSPFLALQIGADETICFDCPHRGNKGQGRTCYVNLRYVNGIWKAYQRGRYAFLPVSDYARVFTGKKVRFGAYGEPVLLPIANVRAIVALCETWTGYTHQWRKAEFSEYREFLMASCDSVQDAIQAENAGWRFFRVRVKGAPLLASEIMCPASPEGGNKLQCARCGKCNGKNEMDAVRTRRSIGIEVHGTGANNFVSLDSLVGATR